MWPLGTGGGFKFVREGNGKAEFAILAFAGLVFVGLQGYVIGVAFILAAIFWYWVRNYGQTKEVPNSYQSDEFKPFFVGKMNQNVESERREPNWLTKSMTIGEARSTFAALIIFDLLLFRLGIVEAVVDHSYKLIIVCILILVGAMRFLSEFTSTI
ncbi:MAG: hypothetical protein GC165_09655 [Armatimonadetes bacterium]|nr:hypothetical protein [Armatimonadota bacterium]